MIFYNFLKITNTHWTSLYFLLDSISKMFHEGQHRKKTMTKTLKRFIYNMLKEHFLN